MCDSIAGGIFGEILKINFLNLEIILYTLEPGSVGIVKYKKNII